MDSLMDIYRKELVIIAPLNGVMQLELLNLSIPYLRPHQARLHPMNVPRIAVGAKPMLRSSFRLTWIASVGLNSHYVCNEVYLRLI